MKLVLDKVQFSYDRGTPTERVVLDSVSLEVGERELLSIVGRTGSGKTTLGLVAAGLLPPTRGRVIVEETLAGGAGVAMVFQVPESQFFEESVFSELAFGPSKQGLKEEAIRRRVLSAMQRVGLDFSALSTRPPLSLSDGEKRRVAIASALSCEPRFLILDEPTVSLDWEATAHVLNALKELALSGVSVIVMTHEVDDVLDYSDRIAVLTEGKVVALECRDRNEIYRALSGKNAFPAEDMAP